MNRTSFKTGDHIRIISVMDESSFFKDGTDHQAKAMEGKTGIISHIDSAGTLWGTWGSLGVIPGTDTVELIN